MDNTTLSNIDLSKSAHDLRNLQLLEEISNNSNISQRMLSQKIGLALGATNFCLKKMVRKGYIKIKGINHKRISYYLTPAGISEKTKLAYFFVEYTVQHYRNLKRNLSSKLNMISQEGIRRIVFYGADEIIEIIFAALHETNLELVGIIDDKKDKQGKRFFGFTVQNLDVLNQLIPDAIFVASDKDRDEINKKINLDPGLSQIPVYAL